MSVSTAADGSIVLSGHCGPDDAESLLHGAVSSPDDPRDADVVLALVAPVPLDAYHDRQ